MSVTMALAVAAGSHRTKRVPAKTSPMMPSTARSHTRTTAGGGLVPDQGADGYAERPVQGGGPDRSGAT